MKLNKSIIIPLLVLLFAGFGFEQLVLPYVSFGSGRWSDSVGTNVSNRSSRINGNLNVTGNYYKNGVLFTGGGGSVISGSDESNGILDEVTGLDFVGNTFSATGDTGTGLLTLTSTMDTNDYYSRYRLDTSDIALLSQSADFAGYVAAAQLETNGAIIGDELVINSTSLLSGLVTVQNGIQIADATKVIINSGNDILYKVTTGGAHKLQTIGGTVLAKVDSSNAFSSRIAGMNNLWNGTSLIAQKLVRGVSPTGNSTVTFAHGITDGKVIGASIWLRHDTIATSAYHTAPNWYVHPNSTYDATLTYYAGFDSLYCWARFPATATATRGDSLYFLLSYIQ